MLDILFYACMISIFVTSIPIWRSIGSRYSNKRKIIEPREKLASPIGLVDLGAMLLVWLLSQLIAVALFSKVANVELSQIDSMTGRQVMLLMLIAGIGQLTAVAIGMAYLVLRYSDTRVIGWYAQHVQADLKLALAAFVVIAPVVLVAQLLLSMLVEYKHPAMEAMVADANYFTIIAVWGSAVVAAPIAEEVVFRGWIQNWLQRLSFQPGAFTSSVVGGTRDHSNNNLDDAVEIAAGASGAEVADEPTDSDLAADSNPYASTVQLPLRGLPADGLMAQGDSGNQRDNWIAIVITSLIFALMHLGQGLAPIPLFGLSILLGYLYQRTGSLLPCIGLHMLNNGYSVFWLTMQILFGDPTADLP